MIPVDDELVWDQMFLSGWKLLANWPCSTQQIGSGCVDDQSNVARYLLALHDSGPTTIDDNAMSAMRVGDAHCIPSDLLIDHHTNAGIVQGVSVE